ncbi:PulJ/GspJ family protein [Nocardioides sp. HB32]
MGAQPTPQRNDCGETLIELLVAITILGIAGVAILAGMAFSVQASAVNRNQAGGGAYLRSAAEAIQKQVDRAGTYASCGSAVATYTPAANSVISSTDVSKGYSITVGPVESWARVAGVSQWSNCDPNGIQRIKLQLTTPGNSTHGSVETMYLVLRQPCDAAGATPCA